jgi:hypothetical protein
MDEFVSRFLLGEFDRKWGTWADHVQSWLRMRQNHPRFILLRYEDMKADPEHELLRVADFLENAFSPTSTATLRNSGTRLNSVRPSACASWRDNRGGNGSSRRPLVPTSLLCEVRPRDVEVCALFCLRYGHQSGLGPLMKHLRYGPFNTNAETETVAKL